MKKGLFLFPACALASFVAAAHAAPVFDPTGFDLRETKAFSMSVLPATALGQPKADAPYRLTPGGIALSSEARKPTAYHARQPRTEFSESRPWRVADAEAMLDATIHIDRFPKSGNVVLAELTADEDATPILRILVDGDRLVLHGQIDNAPENGVVLGTLDDTHTAHIVLHTRPDGMMTVAANGTPSTFRLSPQAMAIPVMFRTGAHAINDIGTTPDQIAVTLTGLSVHHGAAQSGLRS
ncbi:hypothetical protein [Asaia bogorensis]|uniref:hypothetical protein n=1 Tax=Asaia bogorensis TaxID=91915 RepID=UPI000EFBE7B6|nr:hypothetical protein [Asaia bogorensis]